MRTKVLSRSERIAEAFGAVPVKEGSQEDNENKAWVLIKSLGQVGSDSVTLKAPLTPEKFESMFKPFGAKRQSGVSWPAYIDGDKPEYYLEIGSLQLMLVGDRIYWT
jgi:hypothetical protein